MSLRLGILGPLEATREGEVLDLGGPKQRTVLACLASEANRVVSQDALIEAVWGDSATARSAKTLHVYISNLRRALDGPGVHHRDSRIVAQSNGYALHLSTDELDALEFEGLLDAARNEFDSGDLMSALSSYDQALAFWRGDPLADVADQASGGGFRQRLSGVRRSAVLARIDVLLRLGQSEAAIPELRRLSTNDQFDEGIYQRLMLALYRAGRQAEALAVYSDARTLLVDELGIEPGPELRDLERRILDQDAGLLEDEPAVGVEPVMTAMATDVEAAVARVRIGDELLDLRPSVTTIGRRSDRSIVLDGERVSRCHAEIRRMGDDYILVDVGSRNGTRVNGELTSERSLCDGDVIGIGDHELRFSPR